MHRDVEVGGSEKATVNRNWFRGKEVHVNIMTAKKAEREQMSNRKRKGRDEAIGSKDKFKFC